MTLTSSEPAQRNLKQKHPLLVAIRDTRAIVAGDANTKFFYPSSQFTKKNGAMRDEAASNETGFVRRHVHDSHEKGRIDSARPLATDDIARTNGGIESCRRSSPINEIG